MTENLIDDRVRQALGSIGLLDEGFQICVKEGAIPPPVAEALGKLIQSITYGMSLELGRSELRRLALLKLIQGIEANVLELLTPIPDKDSCYLPKAAVTTVRELLERTALAAQGDALCNFKPHDTPPQGAQD